VQGSGVSMPLPLTVRREEGARKLGVDT
jgi:hypothetical protein